MYRRTSASISRRSRFLFFFSCLLRLSSHPRSRHRSINPASLRCSFCRTPLSSLANEEPGVLKSVPTPMLKSAP